MKVSISKKEDVTIQIIGSLTAQDFISGFVDRLHVYMIEDGKNKVPPVISLEHVQWIDADAVPMLLCVGRILRKYYGTSLKLLLPESETVRQFLHVSRFYELSDGSNEDETGIFSFNQMSAFGYDADKKYNPANKVEIFRPYSDYYSLSEDQREAIKYKMQDHYRTFLMGQMFGEIIERKIGVSSEEYDICMDALSEIICNAVLYSMSATYVGVQMLSKNKYSISVCDSGIGFKESLERKDIYALESKKYLNEESIADNRYLEDFFALFTALKYAEETQRTNLWKLVKTICDNNGVIIIHTNRVEVRFDKRINLNSAYDCMNDVIHHYSSDYLKSSMRIFRTRLQGVHIRIVFDEGC